MWNILWVRNPLCEGTTNPSKKYMRGGSKMDYEVLSPWAEVEPIAPRGILPRVTDLSGKTIGLFAFFKQHGPFIMKEVEQKFKEKFPTAKFSHYYYPKHMKEIMEDDEYKASFEEWIKGVDTVVAGNSD
jgi:hypothetical protein